MATNQLACYNNALTFLGERSLSATTEDREPARLLNEVWSRGGGAIRAVLEQGLWNFAIRTVQLAASGTYVPPFGVGYAFEIPTDMVRIVQISASEYFSEPLLKYDIEASLIYASITPLFIRYVSDDASYGADMTKWPESFFNYFSAWLASQIAPRLLNDMDMKRLEERVKRLRVDARSKDAMQEQTKFPPFGSWSRARYGYSYGRARPKGASLIQ